MPPKRKKKKAEAPPPQQEDMGDDGDFGMYEQKVVVQGKTELHAKDAAAVLQALEEGLASRRTGATTMNDSSSRCALRFFDCVFLCSGSPMRCDISGYASWAVSFGLFARSSGVSCYNVARLGLGGPTRLWKCRSWRALGGGRSSTGS